MQVWKLSESLDFRESLMTETSTFKGTQTLNVLKRDMLGLTTD
jgi:hypothetical protein